MGQKVHPIGIRLGINKEWASTWYAGRDYADILNDDIKVRRYLEKTLAHAAVNRIHIERPAKNARVTIHSARPGVIIGKKGGGVDDIRAKISHMMGVPVHLNIEEIRKPELEARLVAQNIAQQLENRVMFRRAMKRAVQGALKAGAKGIKVCVGGRLGGAEIARSEWYREGQVPLHTFKADIDYGIARANTTYGVIGVKVWIYRDDAKDAKSSHGKKEA